VCLWIDNPQENVSMVARRKMTPMTEAEKADAKK